MIVHSSLVALATATADLDRGAVKIWVRVAAVIAVVIAMAIGAALKGRAVRSMKKGAAAIEWSYRSPGTPLDPRGLGGFPIAGVKSGKVDHEISGVWRGRRGKVVVMHDSPPGHSATFQLTMLELTRPMPLVQFHPRSNLQRNFSGGEALTGDSAFDARWRVLCADTRYVSSIATPHVMRRLLSQSASELPVTVDGFHIYSWAPVHRAAKRDLRATLDLLADVAEVLPVGVALSAGPAPVTSAHEPAPAPGRPVAAPAALKKNYLGPLSVLAAAMCFLAPLGIVLGHASLKANRRGEANNHRWAVIGLTFSYIVTGTLGLFFLVQLVGAAIQGASGG